MLVLYNLESQDGTACAIFDFALHLRLNSVTHDKKSGACEPGRDQSQREEKLRAQAEAGMAP